MSLGTQTYNFSLPEKPPLVESSLVFRGDEGNPLLAPRGVWTVNDKLIIADTGQNRVFIWNKTPESEYATPDIVLGQLETTDTGRNSGHEVSANTLQYPSGVWSDGQKLIVADAWNHRVLIWLIFPTKNGQSADVVLGQPDFEHNQPNVKGIGSNPSAKSLNWPYGVFSDGQKLWIADTGNRRVLYFDNIPTNSFQKADKVIGKPSFEERDYENHEPIWPYSVRVSPNGQMSVVDTQYYRTLLWHDWQSAFNKPADVIIGQADFESNGQNQFSLFPKENSLNWVYDSFFYKNGLIIADTGNSRLLWFENIPTENASNADNLIGQERFNIGSENANTRYGTDKQLYWPFSLCISENLIFIADTGNHRIIIFKLNH